MTTCTYQDCERRPVARGLCRTHYARWWRANRDSLDDARCRPEQTCSVEGCEASTRSGARGWCARHYTRWLRHGDPTTVRPDEAPAGTRHVDFATGYVRVKIPGHPLCPSGHSWVFEHRAALYEAIGPGSHDCHWCGTPVAWGDTLIADHLDGSLRNNAPDNLVPSCLNCNASRGRKAAAANAASSQEPEAA